MQACSQNRMLGTHLTQTSKKDKVVEKVELTFEDQVVKRDKRAIFRRTYFPWVRIDELKKDIAKNFFQNKIAWGQLRLFCKNIQLENSKRFFDNNVDSDNSIIIQKVQNITTPENGVINPYQIFEKTPKKLRLLLMAVESGLKAGKKPKLSEQGTSGTYFLEDHQKKKIAIFKPHDEEPFAPSNPRGYIGNLGGHGIRKGILSGECATRQVAAYLLDEGFHKVPPTTYVEFYHPCFNYKEEIDKLPIVSGTQSQLKNLKTKHGSLQQFAQSQDVAGNMGSHQFDIQEVHKIGILDLRILNCDRNEANILVKKVNIIDKKTQKAQKKIYMIPIDHGLSFPDHFEIYDYQMVWMGYPQAKRPFSQESLKFIDEIQPDQDVKRLREKLGFRQICLRNFKIAQIFLKKMAAAGFNLYDIGSKVYRMDDDDSDISSDQDEKSQVSKQRDQNKSQLQKLIQRTEQIYNLVKQNGIRSTVEFQIGLIKLRRQQQQSVTFLQQKKIESIPIMQEHSEKQSDAQPKKQLNDLANIDVPLIKKCSNALPNNKKKQNEFESSPEPVNLKQTASAVNTPTKQTSIEKMQPIKLKEKNSLPKVRNISLPHLKSKDCKLKHKKKKIDKTHSKNAKIWKNQTWEEIFFHYFEDLLDSYISKLKNKSKKPIKPPRGRLMSQNIEFGDL